MHGPEKWHFQRSSHTSKLKFYEVSETVAFYFCPLCSEKLAGPLRLKRHISKCTPPDSSDRKPFRPLNETTSSSSIVIDSSGDSENSDNEFVEEVNDNIQLSTQQSTLPSYPNFDIDSAENEELQASESEPESESMRFDRIVSQKKYSRNIWLNVEPRSVSNIPYDIDGTVVYNITASTRGALLAACRDGRKWKHDSRTSWFGYEKGVRYRDGAGSVVCNNNLCLYWKNIGGKNQFEWTSDGKFMHCQQRPHSIPCEARKYIAFKTDTAADVFHYGKHKCKPKASKMFRPSGIVDRALSIDLSLTPAQIQGNSIVTKLREKRSWSEIDQVVEETAS